MSESKGTTKKNFLVSKLNKILKKKGNFDYFLGLGSQQWRDYEIKNDPQATVTINE